MRREHSVAAHGRGSAGRERSRLGDLLENDTSGIQDDLHLRLSREYDQPERPPAGGSLLPAQTVFGGISNAESQGSLGGRDKRSARRRYWVACKICSGIWCKGTTRF